MGEHRSRLAAQRIIDIERKARGMDRPGSGGPSYEDRLADFMAAANSEEAQ